MIRSGKNPEKIINFRNQFVQRRGKLVILIFTEARGEAGYIFVKFYFKFEAVKTN
jgi:hypothetical protein